MKQKLVELFKNKKFKVILIIVAIIILATIIALLVSAIMHKKLYTNRKLNIVNVEKTSKGTYINNTEKFVVQTENCSLDELKKHLYIEPAVNYTIKQKERDKYEVIAKDIPSDTIVNAIYMDNQVAEEKWAFQSTKDLQVTSIYPSNNTSNNSIYTNIEIRFSYPDVTNVKESVEIEPPVEGEFIQNGRTWILKPTKPLQNNTTYTITVKDSVKYGDKKLLEPVKSTFSTYASTNSTTNAAVNYDSITLDNISTFKPSENPMFVTKKEINRVEMIKLNTSTDFKKYIENETGYNMTNLGDVSFEKLEHNLYKINKTYDPGYYLVKAYLETGELSFTMPIQVNNISAYLLSTQNDILVWVSSNNKVLNNIDIKYGDKSSKTNEEGIAVIKQYNDLSKKLKYVQIGADNPLYVGVNNAENTRIPNSYLYVDRPLYKNTDLINIFGYIPLKYFESSDVSLKDFVLSLDDENIPIEISKDGVFTAKYELDNVKDGNKLLTLKYKDISIATRYISVEQYEKQMYDFLIDYDKNYVRVGDKFKFTVGVKHISGVMVPNKEITAEYDGKLYKAVTDQNGIASFAIDSKKEEYEYSSLNNSTVTIKSGLTESAQKGFAFQLYTISKYLTVQNAKYTQKNKTAKIEVYNLNDNKGIKTIDWNYNTLLRDTPYNGTISVSLQERETVRSITGYNYNEITKENVPIYNYNSTEKIVKSDQVTAKNGNVEYKIDYDFKKATKDVGYSYELIYNIKDRNGKVLVYNQYIDAQNSNSNINGYQSYSYSPVYSPSYDLYDYYMLPEKKQYSVNEAISRELLHYTGVTESENNKYLLAKYKNSIIEEKVLPNTKEINTKFDDNNRPGMNITGAYLKNGNFYRIPIEYIDYKESDSQLDIDIKPNKTKYRPGEEVEAEIRVTKGSKGKKVKLNISVVDEGVFKSTADSTNLLSTIYSNVVYSQYTYSTYRDYNLFIDGGGAGSTSGGIRGDFGDTIYFDTIETDSNGYAKVKFKLNDSITSFRITVHAVNDDVDLGVNHTNIESTLPVSIVFTEPRGIKETDDLVLNALGIGNAQGNIKYEFYVKELNKKLNKEAVIGKTVFANFGKLKSGEYTVQITAIAGKESDKVEYKVHVGTTQTELSIKNTASINELKTIKPVKNPIKLEFYRSSFKAYEQFLDILRKTNEERLDTKFTYSKALEYENKYSEEKNITDIGDVSKFKVENGWKYLPGEEMSYELTALLSYYDETLRVKKDYFYTHIADERIGDALNSYLVLAALKEPILDDLYRLEEKVVEPEDINKLALSYLFLGDYKKVRKLNGLITDNGIKTYLSTFVDKTNASKNINSLYKEHRDDRYLYFAIISFFENNNVDLSSNAKVTVKTKKDTKELEISSLGKKHLTIYQKDLDELKLISKEKDILVNYYYEGNIDEIAKNNKIENIKISLDNNKPKVGDVIKLDIDAANIKEGSYIPLYLPNGLRLSNMITNNFASISSNKVDYVSIYLGQKTNNHIELSLYAASPGSYKIEPIVINDNGKYQLSNKLNITISE